MPPVRVVVANAENAAGPSAELWVGGELMAVAFRYGGRLHLRIKPRPDSEPWLIEAAGLTLALDSAARQILEY